jgi:hypothetical protein
MFPIGLYVYFNVEKQDTKRYLAVFDDFYHQTLQSSSLSDADKIVLFERMLEKNGYKLVEVTKSRVVAEKKILSMGLMMIGIGIYFIGLLVYLLYYFYLQKPHKIEFVLEAKDKEK